MSVRPLPPSTSAAYAQPPADAHLYASTRADMTLYLISPPRHQAMGVTINQPHLAPTHTSAPTSLPSSLTPSSPF
ncbi:hypothetical protein E2C01_044849 [Portunus trituberculatus]|uniref:Uncharacterized protein n=1 Tax=Portunus trituberculatus TaxID=210409 RepID=A0A5B7FWN8_PORTR|nr:hypothetical protein [Portunus trituberculatus]